MALILHEGWKKIFIRHVKNGKPEATAAQLTGVALDKLYKTRHDDDQFAQDWEKAKERKAYGNHLKW